MTSFNLSYEAIRLESYNDEDLRLRAIIVAVIRAIDNHAQTRSTTPEHHDTIALVSILAGLVSGASHPIGPLVRSSEYAVYIHLLTLKLYQETTVDMGSIRLRIQPTPQQSASDARVAWLMYVLIRFGIHRGSAVVLSVRLQSVAAHHGIDTADRELAARVIEYLDMSGARLSQVNKCDWWADFCAELERRRTPLADALATKMTLLVRQSNVTAYQTFMHWGGHEGVLEKTPHHALENVLLATPRAANGMYFATMHLLKERIDDGSIFSDNIPDFLTVEDRAELAATDFS
jgi:hypothetical protein